MTKKLFISLALCLSLLATVNPVLAQADQKSGEDTLAQLQREGWKIVKDGVLQRELVPGEIENFVFGVSGFNWKLQDLQRQLRKLQAEFRANPTPELRKAITNHRKAIANTKRALELARAAEASGEEADFSKLSCAINFSYDASAGPKTDVQGVWADASATFSANCGFTGQVYAMAFAKTWVNGADSTETVTDGPRSGANVSARAYASRNGGGPCESYAYAEMVSYGLNPSSSWYKMVDPPNTACPTIAPPLNATITSNAPSTTIDLYNSDCINITWTTNISGGTSPYTSTMYLNSASQGVRTTYSKSYCNAGTNTSVTASVSATVTDSSSPVQSKSASASTITIRSHTATSTPPLTVTINGATQTERTCENQFWTASVSGGTPPFTYQWTWDGEVEADETGSTNTKKFCVTYGTHTMGLTVTDSANRSGSTSIQVVIAR